MTSHSKQLSLDDVIPGMVLSDDLMDMQGHVLLAQGVTLTAAIVNALRRHDIDSLPVLCESLPAEDEGADRAQQGQRISKLFRRHGDIEPAAELIRQYVMRYRLGDMQ